ncbi:MAG: DUF342 domain-containing protein [Hafnia alvei]
MLNKEWLTQTSDAGLVSLKIAAGLTRPTSELEVQRLLSASRYTRYQPLHDGIKQAVVLLNTLLTDPSTPIPEPEINIAQRRDAEVLIEIEKNGMSASADITVDWGGKPLGMTQLQEAITASGVKKGLIGKIQLLAGLQTAQIASPGSHVKMLIAKGQEAINGQDTLFERLVETPAERILKPREKEQGKIDLRDLGSIITVKIGAHLMRRHPATLGTPGFTVTGQELAPKPGKESSMSAGEGTCFALHDNDLLIAARAGLPCEDKCGMRVDDVLNVKNVDARHGHVTFEGGLLVNGDIRPGMKVKVSGDIVISGFVEGGVIEAGGNITVNNGIIGRCNEEGEYLCRLTAQGSIQARYAQYAQLKAGGNIEVQSQLTHCHCTSGQDIRVGDSAMQKGYLLGGITTAAHLIMAPVFGVSAANHTQLRIDGGYQESKERERTLRARRMACQEQLDKLKHLLIKLVQLPIQQRNPETLRKIKRIRDQEVAKQRSIERELAANQAELERLMATMDIIATKKVLPGVTVEIAHHKMRVDIEHSAIRFLIRDEQLIMQPYDGR